MSKKRFDEIINDIYEKYSEEYDKDNSIGLTLLVRRLDGKSTYRKPDVNMFVSLCQYDETFSKRWGLKIEERELKLRERLRMLYAKLSSGINLEINNNGSKINLGFNILDYTTHDDCNKENIPTKELKLIYNNETISYYE